MKTLFALLSLAIVSPAVAETLPCLAGDANVTLGKLMAASGEVPVLKFEIDTGAEPWPAMIIGKPDGTFSVVVLMHGMTCVMAVGHGMAPAAKDVLFPAAELPGKPS